MEKNYAITDYGAVSEGRICTQAIQRAIDDCFLHGGGVVEVPRGSFKTGGIRLRSNITLLLRSGARLIGSRDPEDYMAIRQDQVEPVADDLRFDGEWKSAMTEEEYQWLRKPLSRWANGLIRALNAAHIRIIGEENSILDGMDCFDPRGEEHYRGPHAISIHFCRDIQISGITIQNSANWAVAAFDCQDMEVRRITVLAGHDGVHATACDRVTIANCEFYTGDDCVAGIDNVDMNISDCVMNTACSAFRLGGTHIRISNCRMFGPARYLFRGSLTPEEKQKGMPAPGGASHRYNMLSAFTYYADFSRRIRQQPGDIFMTDCMVENVDRFLHYNYSGNERWQRNRPLKDIHFLRIQVKGLKMPLTIYGDRDLPVTCEITDCGFEMEKSGVPFLHLCHYQRLLLDHVTILGLVDAPVIKRWSREGECVMNEVRWPNTVDQPILDTQEAFSCQPI